MPSIEISIKELNNQLGTEKNTSELEEALRQIALDVEYSTEEIIKAEYNPNRPDYCTIEGVARQLKGIFELELGLPKYQVRKSGYEIVVDDTVKDVRPFLVSGVVKGLQIDSEKIQKLMKIQEDLHWLVGRKRLKAAIGVHDLDAVKPPFRYLAVNPESVSFVPLGEKKEMNLKEILKKHPKGIEYAYLVDKYDKYPVILDKDGNVLSFPPIINGVLTQVNEGTENLLLEVTGYDLSNVTMALNILATALHDQGGKLESVNVVYSDKTLTTPDLNPGKILVDINNVNRRIGLELSTDEIIHLLRKSRFDCVKIDKGNHKLEVLIPPYRFDILHEVDISEEVAIGYGYQNIPAVHSYSMTVAKPLEENKLAEDVKRVLIGLGLIEVISFTLINEEDHYDKMNWAGEHVQLLNPVSSEYSMVRTTIIPSLLKILQLNKHAALPIKIFEIGDILEIDEESVENKTKRKLNVAIAIEDSISDFTVIKQLNEAFLSELGITDVSYIETENTALLPGRGAEVKVNNKSIGIIGEIHPKVLNNFEIESPVSIAEYDFEKIKKLIL